MIHDNVIKINQKIEISFLVIKKKSNRLVENIENIHLHACINGYKLKRIFLQQKKQTRLARITESSKNNCFIF